MPLSKLESQIVEWVRSQAPALESFLSGLVEQSSHTPDRDGVNAVGRIMERHLLQSGLRVAAFVTGESGQHLIGRTPTREGNRLLMVGHLDTVYPSDGAGYRIDPNDDSRVLGPGVTDMKGGLCVIAFALRALAEAGVVAEHAVTVLLSADEEIGSPTARSLIEHEATDHHLALVFETGSERPKGATTFVTQRRGMRRAVIEIEGVEAHAGAGKEEGASAAVEMARVILGLEELNDAAAGVAVTVGLAHSGTAANTVPGEARLEIDVRFPDEVCEKRVVSAIAAVLEGPTIDPRVSVRLIDGVRYPPMCRTDATERMERRLVDWGADLGLHLEPESRGGASDANLTAAAGCPTVDGLGTVGGRIHSPDEWMRRSSLVDRTALCALTMLRFHELTG